MMENNFAISGQATITIGRIFQPTMMLRFIEQAVPIDEHTVTKVRILQQLWTDMNSRETEWRDVCLEEEE